DFGLRVPPSPDPPAHPDAPHPAALDAEMEAILSLRSRDPDRVVRVLHSDEGLGAAMVLHVTPLLAWHPVAADAVFALRKVAEERIALLIDALIDPNQD